MTNHATIPVIVQTNTVEAAPLCDWPISDLPRVFDLLREWGLVDSDGEQVVIASACADLVVHEGRVVFRVSIMDVE